MKKIIKNMILFQSMSYPYECNIVQSTKQTAA